MKDSGGFRILFTLRSLIRSGSCFSPSLSEVGYWKRDMLVPLKEVVAVVAVGLWSMLSIATAVKSPFLRTEGHHSSSIYLPVAASPYYAETSSSLSYGMIRPWL